MLLQNVNNPAFSWQQYIACPSCGDDCSFIAEQTNGNCKVCKCPWHFENETIIWGNPKSKVSFRSKSNYFYNKIKNQLNPLTSWLLPFRHFTRMRDEKFYQRTISDKNLALKWLNHYLKDIDFKPNDLLLDYGCGRGRNIALSHQLGFNTLGQDIQKHAWWKNLEKAAFQVVPPQYHMLPWKDATFAGIFIFGVLHYLSKEDLDWCTKELFRILKPGGYCIILEANNHSYGQRFIKKQIGRLHSLETIRNHFEKVTFHEKSLNYEGFYAPYFPHAINFVRKQLCARHFDKYDFGSLLERYIPNEKRGLWLMKLQKPY